MTKFIQAVFRKLFSSEFLKFAIVGGISALIEYSLYLAFKLWMDYLVANILAFGITNIVTYILSKIYVFGSSNSNKVIEAALFFLCLLGALMVSQFTLWVLVDYVGMDDRIAKAVAMSVAIVWNFFTRKYIVFRHALTVPQQSSTDSSTGNS
jgi:putative flippase GtrA